MFACNFPLAARLHVEVHLVETAGPAPANYFITICHILHIYQILHIYLSVKILSNV